MQRTGMQRLEAIPDALARADEFKKRIADADGDVMKCADLMAEAIQMEYEARGHERQGKDGRATICVEEVVAAHCAIDARKAYLKARGSNSNGASI